MGLRPNLLSGNLIIYIFIPYAIVAYIVTYVVLRHGQKSKSTSHMGTEEMGLMWLVGPITLPFLIIIKFVQCVGKFITRGD